MFLLIFQMFARFFVVCVKYADGMRSAVQNASMFSFVTGNTQFVVRHALCVTFCRLSLVDRGRA